MAEKEKFITQDGREWRESFFQGKTEQEAIDIFEPLGYSRKTVTAVWKQANGKSEPNKKANTQEKEEVK